MGPNGHHPNHSANDAVLHWEGMVLAADDLRRSLNGHTELVLHPRAIVTPLAEEELRARSIQLTRRTDRPDDSAKIGLVGQWAFAQERPQAIVSNVIRALDHDGIKLHELNGAVPNLSCQWARQVADCVRRGDCLGCVVFCQEPGLFCCVANKVPGLRAAVAGSVSDVASAILTLGINLLALNLAGKTFFEVRRMVQTLCRPGQPSCPEAVASTLKELDGHAHR